MRSTLHRMKIVACLTILVTLRQARRDARYAIVRPFWYFVDDGRQKFDRLNKR